MLLEHNFLKFRFFCSTLVLEASFAPRGFGGWAFPTFGAFCTQESPDTLTTYTGSLAQMITDTKRHPSTLSAALASLASARLSQELAQKRP